MISTLKVQERVGAKVGPDAWAEVGAEVWAKVWAEVWAEVRAKVWAHWTQVLAQVRDQVRDQVAQWSENAIWGQHDAGWLSWVQVMQEIGVDEAKKIQPLQTIARNVCLWWPFTTMVFLAERAVSLHRDAAGRLHNPNGPAMQWADGWAIHAIHGVRVPDYVVEAPHTITLDQISGETNVEVRRVMIEQYGWDRWIVDAELKAVDSCPDPGNPGYTIDLYDLPRSTFNEPLRIILVTNGAQEPDGSRHRFGITVPTDCKTALQAAAWTYGLESETYQLLERRA